VEALEKGPHVLEMMMAMTEERGDYLQEDEEGKAI
jgi:hypothetical protein